MYQKETRFRSERYLDFVRLLECVGCNHIAPSHAHHIKGVGGFSGGSMKASDYLTMPLCKGCHDKIGEAKISLDMQFVWITKTIDRAFRAGVIGLTKDIF